MKYQAVVNVCGCDEYIIQSDNVEKLTSMVGIFTDVIWDEGEAEQACVDSAWFRLETMVVFFSTVQ